MNDIKFEIINGQLCRMVEPMPLTPEATFPCVVRLIQDDSPMGRANKLHDFTASSLQNTYLAERVSDYSVYTNDSKEPISCYAYYEIIGYPVVEGSREWALYQMMHGKAVTFLDWHNRILKLVNGHIQDSSNGFWDRKSGNAFLSYAAKEGWQLYEPEQEHIVETTPCPACHGTGFVDSVFMDEMAVRSSCSCNALSKKSSHEPEHTYKVGDWVELNMYRNHQGQIKEMFCAGKYEIDGIEFNRSLPTFTITGLSGEFYYSRITRKLSHFEVEVDFGFAKGRILSRMSGDVKVLNNKSVVIATIIVSEITNPTIRSLVESLLKAQEEK